MKFDVTPYRTQKDDIVNIIKRMGSDRISEIAATFLIPNVAIYVFAIEEGLIDETVATDKINKLLKFYGYEGIIK